MEQRINLKFLHKCGKSASPTVNGEFYCEVLKGLLPHIRRLHLKQPGSWFILHDNAQPHTAMLAKWFLSQYGGAELSTVFPIPVTTGLFLAS
ncbi:hypothetical protein AVEN_6815-1 [Araneus ventricosus]|uniref:Uncharacterized protein n=1 Tax=Araneus ventricosus TaxID=182803 RepID=A0A4Y2I7A1_ARAVE|nr:hypothetical protein AVEN_6815-1 [Araneus ventricosus]